MIYRFVKFLFDYTLGLYPFFIFLLIGYYSMLILSNDKFLRTYSSLVRCFYMDAILNMSIRIFSYTRGIPFRNMFAI